MMRLGSGIAAASLLIVLLLPPPAGAGWQKVYQFPQGITLLGIDCATPFDCWACGMDEGTSTNRIFRTSDGGRNWEQQYNGNDLTMFMWDIGMVNTETGFISGHYIMGFPIDGHGAKTANGGQSWSPILLPYGIGFFPSVYVLDQQHIYLAGLWGLYSTAGVQVSVNGGQSWQAKVVESDGIMARYAFFINANEGWISCGSEPQNTPTPYPGPLDGEAAGRTTIRYCGRELPAPAGVDFPAVPYQYAAQIYHTVDGGDTWTLQFEAYEQFYACDLFFLDADNGWFVGQSDYNHSWIYRTVNGGETWERVHFPTENEHGLMDILFVSPIEGWAFGPCDSGIADSAILHTVDGGATWLRENVHYLCYPWYGTFPDEHRGFTCGSSNLKITMVLRYDDGTYPDATPTPTGTLPLPSQTPTRTPSPPQQTATATATVPPTATATGAPPTASPTPPRSPTATRAPTQSSPTATSTPLDATATPVPTAPLGADLDLNRAYFTPGMTFDLNLLLSNPGPNGYASVPLCVVLSVYGQYYWYPLWTQEFDHITIPQLTAGDTIPMNILDFVWPDTGSSGATGIMFFAAMLTQDLGALLGNMDSVMFSYGPAQ